MDEWVEKYAEVPQRQRLMLVGLIVVGLPAVHYFIFYSGQEVRLNGVTRQLGQQESIRNEKKSVAQNREQYEAKLAELQRKLDEARTKLPDRAEVPALLAELGNRGQEIGLEILEFNPLAEETKGFYAEIGFQMRVRGSYHEVAMFLDAIGRMDRIVNVTDLRLTEPEAQNAKIVVAGAFDVKTYRFLSADEEKGAGK